MESELSQEFSREFNIAKGVDWSAPWLASLRETGIQVASAPVSDLSWREELNRLARISGLTNHTQLPIQFVAQSELPSGTSYEAHISATGCVPTRDNLHDFFNALVWLSFHAVKSRLNALQAAQIARLGVGKSRGPSRDAATLFDENAALLVVTDNEPGRRLVNAFRKHQWTDVFTGQREQFVEHAEVILFGHAIMEKLVHPYKAITAHTLVCWVDADFHDLPVVEKCRFLDHQVSLQLATAELLPSVFSPLPVLGVPGWWPKQDIEFYADTSVFRPERQRVL